MLPGTEEDVVEYTLHVDSKMKKLLEQTKACPAVPSTSVKEYCEEAISRQVYYPEFDDRVIDRVEWFDGAQEFISSVEVTLGSESEIPSFEPEIKFDTIRNGKTVFLELDENVSGALENGVSSSLEKTKGVAARLCLLKDMYMQMKHEDIFMGKRVYSDRVEEKYKTVYKDIISLEDYIYINIRSIILDDSDWYSMMMEGSERDANYVASEYFDNFKNHEAFNVCVERIGVEEFEEFEEMLQDLSTHDWSDQMGVEQ